MRGTSAGLGRIPLWTLGAALPLVCGVAGALTAPSSGGGSFVDQGAESELSPRVRGELLLGESLCLSCHAAPAAVVDRLSPAQAPRLERVLERVDLEYLRRFLASPSATKVGSNMPEVLASVPEAERAGAVEDLLAHLATLGGQFDRQPEEILLGEVERGRRLFHRKGCVACHQPFEPAERFDAELGEVPERFDAEALLAADGADAADWRVRDVHGAVPLPDLAAKTSLSALTAFLLDPRASRPSGRMPKLLLEERDARAIAAYLLLREHGTGESALVPGTKPGILFEYFEAPMGGKLPDFDTLKPTETGTLEKIGFHDGRRPEHFAYRWRGSVRLPVSGDWTFTTASDDGSQLFVDGRMVVDNDGTHPTVRRSGTLTLEAGDHELLVTMFERDGGESMQAFVAGPGVPEHELGPDDLHRETLLLRPPPEAAAPRGDARSGAALFQSLGCANCHRPESGETPPSQGKPLLELHPDAQSGCLGPAPRSPAPRYLLADEQRASLRVALLDVHALEVPPSAAERVVHTMARLRCFACHERDGIGGPGERRSRYFGSVGSVDMGVEGQIPPALGGVGAKLRLSWLEELLLHGARTRSFMATAMPDYGADVLGGLPAALAEADANPGWEREPEVLPGSIEAGHELVGKEGLACIECHSFGEFPSRGMPAGDLSRVWSRIQPGWFRAWLEKPTRMRRGTRMPTFFAPGELSAPDVMGGDGSAQIDAIWHYLALGESAPVPAGLDVRAGDYDVVVSDRTVLVGVFGKDVSARTLCVGSPERAHYAYDLQNLRLAKAWRGRFLNARGTWDGRAGQLEEPAGTSVIPFAEGPTLAVLHTPSEPWPTQKGADADTFLAARSLDAQGRPSFEYRLGELTVRESVVPVLRPGGAILVQRFEVRASRPVEGLHWRIAEAEWIEARGDEFVLPDGSRRALVSAGTLVLRRSQDRTEALLPLRFDAVAGSFVAQAEVEVRW